MKLLKCLASHLIDAFSMGNNKTLSKRQGEKMNILTKIVLISTAMVLFSSSAFSAREIDDDDFSGWLGDYKDLEMNQELNVYRYINEEAKGNYENVIVKPVIFVEVEGEKSNTELGQQAAKYMTEQLRANLDANGYLTDTAGPKTLQIQMAITGTRKSKEDIKARNLIPVAAIFRAGQAATGNVATYIDVMVESEITDSVSGERVAAVVAKGIDETEKRSGDALNFKDITPVLDEWVSRYQGILKSMFGK